MTTIYKNPTLDSTSTTEPKTGYDHYIAPDTRVPPKAKPILKEISVNGVAIAEPDVLAEAQHHPANDPGEALTAAARALVVRELLLQESRRLGIDAASETDDEGRRETPEDAAIRLLIAQEVSAPSANEAEGRRYYENNLPRFRSDPIWEARHILLAAPESDTAARAAAKSEASRLVAYLGEHPVEFDALARQHSACPSKEQGGNLGQITPGSTAREFEAALHMMQEGEMSSEPVATRFGFHIIALDRFIPGKQLPYELVSERIRGWLEAASWSRAVSQYVAILAGRADIRGISLRAEDGLLVQ